MGSRRLASSLMCLGVVATTVLTGPPPASAQAEQTSQFETPCKAADCLSVLTAGGLLGYLDGFPEYRGWPLDGVRDGSETQSALNQTRQQARDAKSSADTGTREFLGGLIGLRRWQSSHQSVVNQSYLLMSGNNHPQQVGAPDTPGLRPNAMPAEMEKFWTEVDDLHADAIGVGVEDIHRWLAQTTVPGVQEWLRTHTSRPLIASNIIITGSGPDLNVIEDRARGIKLGFAANATVGFVNALSFSFPCGEQSAIMHVGDWSITPKDGITFDAPKIVEPEDGPCTASVKMTRRLRPGQHYTLTLPHTQPFQFHTHDVLTPRSSPDGWNGLPVVHRPRKQSPDAPDAYTLAVMAFVGLEVKDELPEAYRTWTKEQGCRWKTCQIEYLAPQTAARQLWELGSDPGQPKPVLAAISALADDELSNLLDEMPEIRVLSLASESLRLGRAAPDLRSEKPPYSGDLSFGAIIDGPYQELTRLMLRPEWNGESIQRGRADVRPSKIDGMKNTWFLANPRTSGWTVVGVPLKVSVDGENAVYSTEGVVPGSQHLPWTAARYCAIDPLGAFDRSRVRQQSLWTNGNEIIGLLLDEVRDRVKSEVALVPHGWVERGIAEWLQGESASPKRVDWLSGFILQRLLYRVERFVRVTVPSADVAKTLQSIVKEASESGALCVSGLGNVTTCPATEVAVDNLLLNIRRLDEGHYYSIALPVSYAAAAGFDVKTLETFDVLNSLDQRLRVTTVGDCMTTRVVPRAASRTPLDSAAAELELRRSGKIQHYVRLEPFTIEYASTDLQEPKTQQGLFAKLPQDSSSLRDARQLTVDAALDVGLIDTRRFAIRLPMRVRFDKRQLDDQVSYDRDEATFALRGDYKKMWNRQARLFAAFAVDTQFARPAIPVSITRSLGSIPDPAISGAVIENATAPGPKLSFTTERRTYLYSSIGFSRPAFQRWKLKLTNTQFRLDGGWAYHVPLAAKIDGQLVDLDTFIKDGAGKVAADYYASHLTSVTAATPFTYDYGVRRQMRFQADSTAGLAWGAVTFGSDLRFRYYKQFGGESDLATRTSFYVKPNVEVKVRHRMSLVTYLEYTQVRITSPSTFGVRRIGVQAKLTSFFKWGHGWIFE